MTFPTHILAGLIIGKLTGDYTAALTGSLVMDVDHFFSYHRHGVLFKPGRMIRHSLTAEDPLGNQKNIFHSVQAWIIASLLAMALNMHFGLIFSLAYIVHLILDALNGDMYPFYPYKNFYIEKPLIRYLSKQEGVLAFCLTIIFACLVII